MSSLRYRLRRRGIIIRATILCKEGSIISIVVHSALMTSDSWMKLTPENLVDMGDWVNISGCRGMVVRIKTNHCYVGCWCIGGI